MTQPQPPAISEERVRELRDYVATLRTPICPEVVAICDELLRLRQSSAPKVEGDVCLPKFALSLDPAMPWRIRGPNGERIADCSSSLTASALLASYNAASRLTKAEPSAGVESGGREGLPNGALNALANTLKSLPLSSNSFEHYSTLRNAAVLALSSRLTKAERGGK